MRCINRDFYLEIAMWVDDGIVVGRRSPSFFT
jgi:hypothetical protein